MNILFFSVLEKFLDRNKPKFRILHKDIFSNKESGSSVKVNAISDGMRWNMWERTSIMFTIPRKSYPSTCRIAVLEVTGGPYCNIKLCVSYKV